MNTFLIIGSAFSLWMLIPWGILWCIFNLFEPESYKAEVTVKMDEDGNYKIITNENGKYTDSYGNECHEDGTIKKDNN
tara:strand:+ start:209 stop:442 length:234 start_codon:yes stop_codon:yes gene_type:complete